MNILRLKRLKRRQYFSESLTFWDRLWGQPPGRWRVYGVFYHSATCLSFPLIAFSWKFCKVQKDWKLGSQIFSSAYCCRVANKKPYLSRFQGRSRSPGIAGEGSHLGAVAAVAFGSAKRARSEVRKGQVKGTVHWFSWSCTCWNCWNLPWYVLEIRIYTLLYTHLTSLSLHLRWSKVYLLVFYFFLSHGWFQSSNLQSAWRLLGALAFFPELLGSERSGSCSPCVALCLARLSGVRYGRDAVVDQETAVLWRGRMMRDDGSLFL